MCGQLHEQNSFGTYLWNHHVRVFEVVSKMGNCVERELPIKRQLFGKEISKTGIGCKLFCLVAFTPELILGLEVKNAAENIRV